MRPREISVEEMEMKKAYHPDTLASGGLGPCIAIGIYDQQTRSGYMMHEPRMKRADLEGKIAKIKEDYGDLSRLKVFATGNAPTSVSSREQAEYERSVRPYIEQTLQTHFDESQITIHWAPTDSIAELFLETSTGEFRLEIESLDETLDEVGEH